jgi:hypothetical protein
MEVGTSIGFPLRSAVSKCRPLWLHVAATEAASAEVGSASRYLKLLT